MFNQRNKSIIILLGALALVSITCRAQDYDDEGYGPQGGGGGGNNQGDPESYSGGGGGGGNYGNEDGYNNGNNMPNYQQNVDSEGTNSSPNQYSPQGGSDADGDYEGDDGSAAAAASSLEPTVVRVRRSTPPMEHQEKVVASEATGASEPKLRVKRHGKYYIGPVYTYVKTDKHANFKWGVKHKVGKKHYG